MNPHGGLRAATTEERNMCDCYDVMKEKLLKHFEAKVPEGAAELGVELHGYMYGITDEGRLIHRVSNAVTVRYLAPKKAGGMKKVVSKTELRANYCPFCGVSYEESEKADTGAAT